MESRILYEDNQIIVCHKPAGIATQTSRVGQRDMVSEVTGYLVKKGNKQPYVGMIHRLDQPVEGILVFAKDKQTAANLSRQIAGDEMKKGYLAVICGKQPGQSGELVDYLLKDGRTNMSRVVPKEVKGAKIAKLGYEIVALADDLSLVKIHLQTGRHHQIRVQMSHAGMSLLGDYKYADDRTRALSAELQVKEVALCANELTFRSPKNSQKMHFEIKPQGTIFQRFEYI